MSVRSHKKVRLHERVQRDCNDDVRLRIHRKKFRSLSSMPNMNAAVLKATIVVFPKAFLDFLPAAIELTTPDAESIKLVYVDRGNDALVYRSEQYKGIVFKLCEDSLWRCSRKWTFLPPSQACI